MPSKYYVARESLISGRVEYQRCKCIDRFCSEAYIKANPKDVWQFSKQGAVNIVNRENARGWNYKYFIVPVSEILQEV